MNLHLNRNILGVKRLSRLGCLLWLVCHDQILAQYGASPTQTGLFFDDLRSREESSRLSTSAEAGVRSGEAVYDYEHGVYRDSVGDEREMGQTVSSLNEAARQMGQPTYRSGSGAFASRYMADYTYYAGQYASPTSFFAPPYVSDPFMGGRRNVKLGGVNVGLGLSTSLEYNDNVTRASVDPVEDLIGSVFLNVDANYQITRYNQLSLTTTLGFDHYFMHPEVAPYGSGDFVLNVLPGSTISFDLKVGPVFIVIYDRFAVRPAVRNDFALAANQIFGVWQNDAGMAAMWDINSELSLALNYMHSTSRALEEQYEIFDRDMDSLFANLTWTPSGTWSLGLEGGFSSVRYPEGFNNDGILSNIGVVFNTPIGDTTFLRVAGGYQHFDFDSPSDVKVSESDVRSAERAASTAANTLATEQAALTGLPPNSAEYRNQERRVEAAQERYEQSVANAQTVAGMRQQQLESNTQDSSDLDGDYYFNLTLTNQLTSRISQVLNVGHESSLSNISNYVTATYAAYGVSIIAWRGSRLSLSTYYEDAEMSGGRLTEDLEQYGFDLYLSHAINSWCRAGAGYHYGVIDSNLVDRDYDQNSVNVDISFALSRKASLSLGYMFYTTDADLPTDSFDQNRVIMSFNYNF